LTPGAQGSSPFEEVPVEQGRGQGQVLRGERVTLRPLLEADLPLVRRWRADREVTRYWISEEAPSEAEVWGWYVENRASGTLTWAILDERGTPIGFTNLFDIDRANRHAELALMIGERAAWGRGYARDALRVLLGHAFAGPSGLGLGLGLHKVALTVFSENRAARRAYAACGFHEDGVLRDDFYRAGRWHDQILMSILEDEFRADESTRGRQAE
jgi:RimJ/RimL family protein N-acetyltransferase